MHRAKALFFTFAILIVWVPTAWAKVLSAPLMVTATVMNTCRVQDSSPADVRIYDELGSGRIEPMNGLGGISVVCSAGTDAMISTEDDSRQGSFVMRVTWENTYQMTYEVYRNNVAVASGQWEGALRIAARPPARSRLLPVYDLLPDDAIPEMDEPTVQPQFEIVSIVF